MNCLEISQHLSAYLDDELEPEFIGRVKEHLAACETCRSELAALRRLTETVRALPRESAPPDIQSEVVAYIERDMLLRRDEPARAAASWRKALGAVALAAASAVIAVGAYRIFTHEETATPPGEFTVAKGETPERVDDFGAVAESDRKSTTGGALKQHDDVDRNGDATAHAFDSRPTPSPEPESARKKGTGGETDFTFETKTPGTKREPSAPVMLAGRDKEGEFEKKADSQLGAKTAGTGAPAAMGELARLDAAEQTNAPKPEAPAAATPTPPAPEFLDLVVTARDFEATRTRLVACAAELDIHTVERDRITDTIVRGTTFRPSGDATETRTGRSVVEKKVEPSVGGGGARGAGTNVVKEPLPTDVEKTRAMRREVATPTRTAEQPTAEAERPLAEDVKDQEKRKEAVAKVTPDFAGPEMHLRYADGLRGPAPALVFAVPREKFPQFVARLAAEGVRVQIAPRAEIEKLTMQGRGRADGRIATAPAEAAPLTPAKTEAETRADMKTLEEAAVDKPARRPAAARPEVNGVAVELRDDGKEMRAGLHAGEAPGKGVQTGEGYAAGRRALGVDPNMVYVQIYFASVEAPVPAEAPAPANKPDADKKPDVAKPADPVDR